MKFKRKTGQSRKNAWRDPEYDNMDLRAVGTLRMAAKAEALDRSDRRKLTTPYLNLDLDTVPDKVIETETSPSSKGALF